MRVSQNWDRSHDALFFSVSEIGIDAWGLGEGVDSRTVLGEKGYRQVVGLGKCPCALRNTTTDDDGASPHTHVDGTFSATISRALSNVSRFYCAAKMVTERGTREPPDTSASVAIAC